MALPVGTPRGRRVANNRQSWNVYNADNIARVKADEAAAAQREAAREQRMQEVDAARRAAILRGQTPPPLPTDDDETHEDSAKGSGRSHGHDRKRRRLAGEDDTDRDIRVAASHRDRQGDAELAELRLVKLRKPTSDAPLTDHAGHIDLFPVDLKELLKREKNEEAEKEKRKRERALEDQYTMRLSNAAGRGGEAQQPWYASGLKKTEGPTASRDQAIAFPTLENKDVWGNEDPLRKEREQARITSNDPLALMQRAQVQLKKSKEIKKKLAEERERELMELRAAQERSDRRERHVKRKKRVDDDDHHGGRERREKRHSGSHRHRHGSRDRSRDRSRERRHEQDASHRRRESEPSRSSGKGRERDRTSHGSSHRHGRRSSDREERAYEYSSRR